MTRRVIPTDQWREFLDQFSRRHHGKSAQITVSEPGVEPYAYATNEAFLGLVDEGHGQADETIILLLGAAADGTSSHPIAHPVRVSVSEWNDAYSAELKIESSDGRGLTVQVGSLKETLPPGAITDGIMLEKSS